MGTYYVGLDVHSKQSAFVIEDDAGKVIAQGEVPTTPAGFSGLAGDAPWGRVRRWRSRRGRLRSSSPVS